MPTFGNSAICARSSWTRLWVTISRAREIRISEEAPFDVASSEALLDEAFGGGRAAKTSARLREGRLPAQGLALVAKDKGALVGTLTSAARTLPPSRQRGVAIAAHGIIEV